MSIRRVAPEYIRQPDPESRFVEDRLHWAIYRGKFTTVIKLLDSGTSVELTNRSGQTPLFCAAFLGHYEIVKLLLKLGADPNRRCSTLCCTPVHAACYSGNCHLLTALLIAGGDLRYHDQKNRTPRDWAMQQSNSESRLATLSLIESFRQMAMKNNDLMDSGVGELNNSTPRNHASYKLPTKLRNTLAAIGLVCGESCEYVTPLGTVQGTGFGKILYGRGESAAAFWPVPLVNESEISDPDNDGCDVEADLNGLLPRGMAYRTGPTTEMVSRRWHQTAVSVRRMKDNQPPDLLFEELRNMSRLRHPGLMLLLGVSAMQHWESVQLVYEPIYHGSLHHRLHIMGSAIPLAKRLLILQQICDALLFLHSKDLLHCSVSSHSVHLVSTSRAKLGCLETLTEDKLDSNETRKVYRKVPSSHWDWLMPWLSPECARGEGLCRLSDVYSFCCLVWETCCEKLPWAHMDAQQISRMWRSESIKSRMLNLCTSIPLHIASFLKLGLQPELTERSEMDLQEIYLMLRLQAAALTNLQKKEEKKLEPIPFPSQHGWEAVKERLKKKNQAAPPPPPPLPPATISEESSQSLNEQVEESDSTQAVPNENPTPESSPVDSRNQSPHQPTVYATPIYNYDGNRSNYNPPPPPPPPLPFQHCRNNLHVEFAIKPASHNTERHSVNCLMAERNVTVYHTPCNRDDQPHAYSNFNDELREAVAHPVKLHREMNDFETWRNKIDEVNEETTVEVTGHPSSTSTPRHQLGFVACSSAIEDQDTVKMSGNGGVKPKRSLKFNTSANQALSSSRMPSFFALNNPGNELVASLTAIFQGKMNNNRTRSPAKAAPNVGDTFNVESDNCVSRGVQCNALDLC